MSGKWQPPKASDSTTPVVFEIKFDRPDIAKGALGYLMLGALGKSQTAVLNGKTLYQDATPDKSALEILINEKSLQAKDNSCVLWLNLLDDWGMRESLWKLSPAAVRNLTPAAPYERRVFNGLAQVIVQAGTKAGSIELTATSAGLKSASVSVKSAQVH